MILRERLLFPLAFTAALLVTFSLFTLMQTMIAGEPQTINTKSKMHVIDFVRLAKPEQVERKKRVLPQRPQNADAPDLKMPEMAAKVPSMNTPDIYFPQIELPIRIGGAPVAIPQATGKPVAGPSLEQAVPRRSIGTFARSSEVIPLVRIQPRYPAQAARNRLSGTVIVEFEITPDGSVTNPRVVRSEPSNIFDEAAVKAILRWKFKPKIVDGKPVSQYASQEFKFTPR